MIPPSVCSTRHREKYDRGLTKIWFALALCLIHFLVPISSGSVGPERIVFILHWEAGSLGFRLASSSRRTTKEWIPNTLKKQVCGNPPETVSRRVYSRETGAFTVLPSQCVPWCFPMDWHPHFPSRGARPPLQSAQEPPCSVRSHHSEGHYSTLWLLPPLCHFLTISLLASIAARR